MIELTNSLRKLVAQLDERKHRKSEGLFKVEGTKCVTDTTPALSTRWLLATDAWLGAGGYIPVGAEVIKCTRRDLERMSSLSTPPDVIAVCEIPHYAFDHAQLRGQLVLALDTIQDPGNFGTIMRIADWFGIHNILCSRETVDFTNPKAVQATMGALSRVKVHYCDLAETLRDMATAGSPVYGTFLDADDIYSTPLSSDGIIVIGNEGRGISTEVAANVNRRIKIPSYPPDVATSESLNAAVATAITVATFRRFSI